MTLKLYAHPLSSYCWKVLVALYEGGLAFEFLELSPDLPGHNADFAARWPLAKMPLLLDGEAAVAESSIIVEHLQAHGGAALIPAAEAGLRVRFLDRVFDNYVHAPMQRIVADRNRVAGERDAVGVAQERALIARSYDWLERELAAPWAAGGDFTLADCAAAPALFYADKVAPIGDHPRLAAYLTRLIGRPSVARAIEGARPVWHMFPYARSAAKDLP